jgi:hypothetical protein
MSANKREQAISEALMQTIILISEEKKVLYLSKHNSRTKTTGTDKDIANGRTFKHPKLVKSLTCIDKIDTL